MRSLSTLAALAGRELRALFYAPSAWAVLAVITLLLGFLFLTQLDFFLQNQARFAALPDAPGVTQLIVGGLFGSAGVVLMMIVPMLTMHTFSQERREQTLTLLLGAPVSLTQIVLGKFIGVLLFLAVVVGVVSLMPLSLLLGGSLNWGLLAANLLGLVLLLGAFSALGLFISSLTDSPMIAAVAGFGALLLLWLIDWMSSTGDSGSDGVLSYLSLLHHYQNLLQGLVDSRDLLYFVLFTLLFLILTVRRLDGERLGG